MTPENLQTIATELADARLQTLALAKLLKFGLLVDARSIALDIARQISNTARELEARTKQAELRLDNASPSP